MNIVICLDYSSFTEEVLNTAGSFISSLKEAEVTVLHIIDEQLFYATTGYEVQLGEDLESESKKLEALCMEYLGPDIVYNSAYGIPQLKIDEMLGELNYDLVIAGSHSRHGLGERLVGSFAEHLLRNTTKPVLIIP